MLSPGRVACGGPFAVCGCSANREPGSSRRLPACWEPTATRSFRRSRPERGMSCMTAAGSVTPQAWDEARALVLITSLKNLPGASMPIAALQEEFGYIPDEAIPLIAEALALSRPKSWASSISTRTSANRLPGDTSCASAARSPVRPWARKAGKPYQSRLGVGPGGTTGRRRHNAGDSLSRQLRSHRGADRRQALRPRFHSPRRQADQPGTRQIDAGHEDLQALHGKTPKRSLGRLFHLIGSSNLRGEVEEYATWMGEGIKSGSCQETLEPGSGPSGSLRRHQPSRTEISDSPGRKSWPARYWFKMNKQLAHVIRRQRMTDRALGGRLEPSDAVARTNWETRAKGS
jgi:hypothetical protein